MSPDAAYWIEHLNLTKHVEGGSFRETYRSGLIVPSSAIGGQFSSSRNIATNIYFLLEHGQFSASHKIKSDETWHFYEGQALDIFEFSKDGQLKVHKLGRDPSKGESFQLVITSGNWFGSRVSQGGIYSLVGCTVAPGFDFADFELGDRETLGKMFPLHKTLISEMTYT